MDDPWARPYFFFFFLQIQKRYAWIQLYSLKQHKLSLYFQKGNKIRKMRDHLSSLVSYRTKKEIHIEQ